MSSLIRQFIDFRAKSYNPNTILNIIHYFRDHGKSMEVHAPKQRRMPRQCFSNATQCALNPDYLYVEGYVVPKSMGFPIEHAWIYDKAQGVYLDPTLGDPEENEYFGLIFPKQMMLELSSASAGLYRGNLFLTLSSNAFSEEQQSLYRQQLDRIN